MTPPRFKDEAHYISLKRDVAYIGDVDPAVEEKVADGIEAALTFIDKPPGTPLYGGNLAAGRAYSLSTLLTYETHYRGLIKFFKLIGDYHSLLMLRDHRPFNCPSMNVVSLILYLRWKFYPPTKALTSLANSPILDVTANPIMCTGDWNAPEKRKQFSAAINCVHLLCGQTCPYQEMCPECRALPENNRHKGCNTHKGNPRLLRAGYPQLHDSFITACDQIKRDRLSYVPKPCGQLLPSQMRQIRDHLLSANSIVGLQTMTIIMVSTCLFLRFDEVNGMLMEHFLPELFVYDDAGYICALCLKVCGKTDATWVTLMLWTDDVNPEFCPVRLLLIYLHVSGIKSGVLFPTEEELREPPVDGIFVDPLTYKVLMARTIYLIRTMLKLPTDNFKVGLHVPRRTGYLFAIFGCGKTAGIAPSARHNNLDTAIRYAHDASTLFIMDLYRFDSQNRVTKWKPILLLSPAQAHVLNVNSIPFYSGIVALSTRFVEAFLNIGPTHPSYRSPSQLCARSVLLVPQANSAENLAKLIAPLPRVDQTKIHHMLQMLVQEKFAYAMGQLQNSAENPIPLENPPALPPANPEVQTAIEDFPMAPPLDEVANPPPPAKKSRKARTFGHVHLPHLALISASTDPTEKVRLIVEMGAMMAEGGGMIANTDLTAPCYNFVIKYANKVSKCVKLHFNSSVDAFIVRYPRFLHTTFKCTCVG